MRRVATLSLALALMGTVAMAQPYAPAQARNLELIRSGFDAWREGRGSPFDLLAEDAVWTIVGHSDASKTYPNRESFKREVIAPFNARMDKALTPQTPRLYADGDTVIAFFDASGVATDGQPYANTYAWFMEMKDGRIVRAQAFFDSVEFNDLWRRVRP
jgi:ketosteroid isomerase-like protein